MPIESMVSLLILALLLAMTPGPNNIILVNSGVTFGLKKTTPVCLGMAAGFTFMMFLVALGVGVLFSSFPVLNLILKSISTVLLLWIAYKIWNTGSITSNTQKPRPLTFFEGAIFQWVNPKSWAMVLAVTAQFVIPDKKLESITAIVLVISFTGIISTFSWAGLGHLLQQWFLVNQRLKWFNWAMALLILVCVGLLFLNK